MPKALPKLQRVAAYAVILRDERILLTRLARRISADEQWHLPGGGLDHGEDPRDALVREIREETGLDAEVGDTARVYSAHLPSMWRQGRRWDYHALRIVYDGWVPRRRAGAAGGRGRRLDGRRGLAPAGGRARRRGAGRRMVTEALADHSSVPDAAGRRLRPGPARRRRCCSPGSPPRGSTPARGRCPAAASTTASAARRAGPRGARGVRRRRARSATCSTCTTNTSAGPRRRVASRTSTGCTWSSPRPSPPTPSRASSRSTARPTRWPGCRSPRSTADAVPVLDVVREALAADPGARCPLTRLGRVNPRYRRLVIPVALVGLILIVVIAALVRQMSEPLLRALARMRGLLLDDEALVRAVASGRQKRQQPRWRRVELRYVDLKAGRHLQVTAYDETQAHTANHARGDAARRRRRRPARRAVRQLARRHHDRDPPAAGDQEGRGRGAHRAPRRGRRRPRRPRPRPRQAPAAPRGRPGAPGARHLRPRGPDQAEPAGEVPPGRGVPAAARRRRRRRDRQGPAAHARPPSEPLRVVDLGCGNAYLTFAAQRYLTRVRGLPVHLTGVDVKQQSRDAQRGGRRASSASTPTFVAGDDRRRRARPRRPRWCSRCTPATPPPTTRWPGRSSWDAPLVLAAPCCHHDIAAQLRTRPTPAPYAMLTRHGILRERFADTLTDALRASLLRLQGYRVDVVEFVDSKHTPRNTLLRARAHRRRRSRAAGPRRSTTSWSTTWGVRPGWPSCSRCLSASLGRARWSRRRSRSGSAVGAGRRRHGPRLHLPGPGDRRVQRAGGPRRAGRHHQRLRRHRPGLRRRPGTGETVGVTHWSTTRPTSRRWPRPGPGTVWVGDIGDNLGEPRRRRRSPGAGRARRPHGRRPTSYRLAYPDGAHDAETLLRDPVTGRLYVVTKGVFGGTVYAAPAQLSATGPTGSTRSATCCRSPPTARSSPTGGTWSSATTRAPTVYAFPSLRAGRRRSSCPPSSRARGSRSAPTARLYVSSEGPRSPCSRCGCPARSGGDGRPSTAVAQPARRRPGSRRATVRAARRPSHDAWPGWPWPRWRIAGWRPRGRCVRAERRRAAPFGVRRRAGPGYAAMPRLRRTSPDQPGLDPPPRGQGLRLPRRGRRAARRPRTSSGSGPGDPAGVGGRVDLPVRRTATSRPSAPTTPAGGSTSTTRTGGSGATRRSSTGCSSFGTRAVARPASGCSPTSAPRGCRWSAPAPPPCGCSTWATSGSATTSTPTRTAASG